MGYIGEFSSDFSCVSSIFYLNFYIPVQMVISVSPHPVRMKACAKMELTPTYAGANLTSVAGTVRSVSSMTKTHSCS